MNLLTEKRKYIKPITESIDMILEDFIAKSPENYSGHIDGEQDDWGGGDSIIIDPDPDEEIDW